MESMITPKPICSWECLVEVVEHHFGLLAALQFDDDAHAVAVAMVRHVGDAFDALFVDHRGDLFEQLRLVHLVGDFGDDDLLAVLAQRSMAARGANLELAAAPWCRLRRMPLRPRMNPPVGKVRTLHDLEQLGEAACPGC